MPFFPSTGVATRHSSKNIMVGQVEVVLPFPVTQYFDTILNRGPAILIVGLDENTTEVLDQATGLPTKDLLRFKAGEGISTFPRPCGTVYLRAEIDTASAPNTVNRDKAETVLVGV